MATAQDQQLNSSDLEDEPKVNDNDFRVTKSMVEEMFATPLAGIRCCVLCARGYHDDRHQHVQYALPLLEQLLVFGIRCFLEASGNAVAPRRGWTLIYDRIETPASSTRFRETYVAFLQQNGVCGEKSLAKHKTITDSNTDSGCKQNRCLLHPIVDRFTRLISPQVLHDYEYKNRQNREFLFNKMAQFGLGDFTALSGRSDSYSSSPEEVILTGSSVEGASLARYFNPNYKHRMNSDLEHLEIDLMFALNYDNCRAFPFPEESEANFCYSRDSEAFVHLKVSEDTQWIRDFAAANCTDIRRDMLIRKAGCYYFSSLAVKKGISQVLPFAKFGCDSLVQTNIDDISTSAAITLEWSDDEVRHVSPNERRATDEVFLQENLAKFTQFERKVNAIMKDLQTIQSEIIALRQIDTSLDLQLEYISTWSRTCHQVNNLIFDFHMETAVQWWKDSFNLDMTQRVESTRNHVLHHIQLFDRLYQDANAARNVSSELDHLAKTYIESNRMILLFRSLCQMVTNCRTTIEDAIKLNRNERPVDDRIRNANKLANKFSVDFVPCMSCSFWPKCARDWLERARLWPSQATVEAIARKGVHLVPKSQCHYDIDWRWSFSVAEMSLAQRWTPCQHHVYFIFKSLFYSFVKPVDKDLTSYLAKTVMMHVSEQLPQSWWREENAPECLAVLLTYLLSAFKDRQLSHYFIPSVNLLVKLKADVTNKAVEQIKFIMNAPLEALERLEEQFAIIETFMASMEPTLKNIGLVRGVILGPLADKEFELFRSIHNTVCLSQRRP